MKINRVWKLTLWANRAVAALVLALIVTLPALMRWYGGLLGFMPPTRDMWAIVVAFDCCAVFIVAALWNMEKLMKHILRQQIFVQENVKCIRRIRWYCGIVALLCLGATAFALPMLLFAAIMGFLCLVVSVVGSVLEAAVALREENDLTI